MTDTYMYIETYNRQTNRERDRRHAGIDRTTFLSELHYFVFYYGYHRFLCVWKLLILSDWKALNNYCIIPLLLHVGDCALKWHMYARACVWGVLIKEASRKIDQGMDAQTIKVTERGFSCKGRMILQIKGHSFVRPTICLSVHLSVCMWEFYNPFDPTFIAVYWVNSHIGAKNV